MFRKLLVPLVVVIALLAAGEATADATPRPPTVTVTTCDVNATGVRVCVQKIVPVHFTHPGWPSVTMGTCAHPAPLLVVHRSGVHVRYTLDSSSPDVWLLTAHTDSIAYRMTPPTDRWMRLTRRTYRTFINVSGATAQCGIPGGRPAPEPAS